MAARLYLFDVDCMADSRFHNTTPDCLEAVGPINDVALIR
jgi:hypothetical protein